jgi:cation diffusion facilitator CzcD-associated flavoprotein CzcO
MAAFQEKTEAFSREKLEAVKKRYTEEANKRLNAERLTHFIQLTQTDEKRLRELVEDPWADHDELNRKESPIKENGVYKHFVLGAGFGGIQYAVRLIEDGLATADEIRLLDAAGGFGGTWYWNRFPGLHCDVESYVYLPLLEETGYVPTKKYAPGQEIREHAEHIAAKWNLEDKTLFRTDVEEIAWNDQTEYWTIKVTQNRGPSEPAVKLNFHAHYVYLAAGVLTKPQIPDIPGVLSFSGSMFHTARWNYSATGGSQKDQRLTKLNGKKVAVVGTAATAIGVIPEVAKYAAELYVIQRTPAYVKRRDQRPTDLSGFKTQVSRKKGWQYERQINLNKFLTNSAAPGEENLVGDGWTDMPAYSAVLGSPGHGLEDASPEALAAHVDKFHALDLPHMEAIRDRVADTVKDPQTAEKLKPWFPSWCKRPTFSDTYLETFNRQNVHLVDTDGKGPSKITKSGIVVGEQEYPVDVIIFGTGYQSPSSGLGNPAARTNVKIYGRGGESLSDKWLSKGAATFHGYATYGFPNLFFTGMNQATITGNNVFMLGLIAGHVAYSISQAERRVGPNKRAIVEATKEAEEFHTSEVLRRAAFYAPSAGCTPGYFNGYGEGSRITDADEKLKRARGVPWSEGTVSFLEYIQNWRDEGSLKGLSITSAADLKSKL